MSALGDMIRDYEKQLDEQENKLNEIKEVANSCFKMNNAISMEEGILNILAILHK